MGRLWSDLGPIKNSDFCSKTTKFSPKLAYLTIAGAFGALLMGWLVVVARGLYLARHLYTLFTNCQENKQGFNIDDAVCDRRENLNQVWIGRCWALGSLGGWRPPSTDPVSGISSCLRMAETLTENGWTADQPRNRRNSETENWHHCLLWVGFQVWVFPYNSTLRFKY